MARYKFVVESAAGVAAGTVIANLVPGTATGFKGRRAFIGVRTVASAAPIDMQLTMGIYRATARGTATTTATGVKQEVINGPSQITGLDTAWSTPPTIPAAPDAEWSFNVRGPADLPWEFFDQYEFAAGVANGMAFALIGNAAPTAHIITMTLVEEE